MSPNGLQVQETWILAGTGSRKHNNNGKSNNADLGSTLVIHFPAICRIFYENHVIYQFYGTVNVAIWCRQNLKFYKSYCTLSSYIAVWTVYPIDSLDMSLSHISCQYHTTSGPTLRCAQHPRRRKHLVQRQDITNLRRNSRFAALIHHLVGYALPGGKSNENETLAVRSAILLRLNTIGFPVRP